MGLLPKRVDEVESNERITDRVLESITKAEFVIVDLTKERPNVFLRLGMLTVWGKFQFTWGGTTIRFDVKDYPIIKFRNIKELKEGITKRLLALTQKTSAL